MTMQDPKELKINQLKENGQKQNGGSNDVTVTEEPVAIEPEAGAEGAEQQTGATDPEAQRIINEAMIETAAKTVGKVVALLTKIPEMDFDEDEVEQLKRLWSSLIPAMSPMTGAIIGTVIIVAGKAAIFTAKRKEMENGKAPTAAEAKT